MPKVKITFVYRGWEDDYLVESDEVIRCICNEEEYQLLKDLKGWLDDLSSRFSIELKEE